MEVSHRKQTNHYYQTLNSPWASSCNRISLRVMTIQLIFSEIINLCSLFLGIIILDVIHASVFLYNYSWWKLYNSTKVNRSRTSTGTNKFIFHFYERLVIRSTLLRRVVHYLRLCKQHSNCCLFPHKT